MLAISPKGAGQTVITTLRDAHASAQDLMERLQLGYDKGGRPQPGFIFLAWHMSEAMPRICTYSQRQRREDYQAMLRTPGMRERNRVIAILCKGGEPVMYEVVGVV